MGIVNNFLRREADVMSTQQKVIRRFMRALDEAALDEAIRSCSSFDGLDGLINQFISDCEGASSAEEFLLDKCGIVLDNDDTGAITGSDAGGSITKTAESIVEESGEANYPEGTSFEIDGLTVNVPERDTLTEAQQNVIRGLYSWWVKGALDLIKESYGENYSFGSSGSATVRELDIEFVSSGSFMAQSGHRYSLETGEATALVLQINMKFYNSLSADDVDGVTTAPSAVYLDRALAHEMTHAVMAANVTHFAELPGYIKEGIAELTHGIDDQRRSSIETLAGDATKLRAALSSSVGTVRVNGVTAPTYAAGYMLMRYLARQASAGYYDGVKMNRSGTKLTVGDPFEGVIEAADFSSKVKTIDARKASGALEMIGNEKNNILRAGLGGATLSGGVGNDKLYGGSGADVFEYDGGKDVIYNYASDDVIRLLDGTIESVKVSGSSVKLMLDVGSLTIKKAVGVELELIDADGIGNRYLFDRTHKTLSTALIRDTAAGRA